MKNKITRKGRYMYVGKKHVLTFHTNNGRWHYSFEEKKFELAAEFRSFRLAVKAAKILIQHILMRIDHIA